MSLPIASPEKPRIVWLYPKLDKPMGGTNFVIYAAAELKRYFDVVIVAQEISPSFLSLIPKLDLQIIDLGCRAYTEPLFWLFYPLEIVKAARRLREVLRNDDVIVSSMFPMQVIAQRLGRNDIQILYEAYSLFHDPDYIRDLGIMRSFIAKVLKMIYGADEIESSRSAFALLTLSAFEGRRIDAIYGRSAEVIYEGVDASVFYPAVEPSLPEFENRTLLLHSTGFERYKGTDTVIAAIPELVQRRPSVHLAVTWTRENATILARYKEFLDSKGVSGHVTFLGRVPYSLLPRLYRTATVYVEPGVDRSMSLSVKEAMACGTPVVRGNEGTEEVTDGVEGFLVRAGDVSEFVDCVLRICDDSALRARMSQAGVQRIQNQFTWAAVVGRLAVYIQAVIRKRQRT